MSRLIEPNCTFLKDSFQKYLEVNADAIAKTWRIDDVIVAPCSPTSADLIAILWHPDEQLCYWKLACHESFPINLLFIIPQAANRHDNPLEYFAGVMKLLAAKGFTIKITYWSTHKFVESLPRSPTCYTFTYTDGQQLTIETWIESEHGSPYTFTILHDHEQGVCTCWELLAQQINTETCQFGHYSIYAAFERNLSREELDSLIASHSIDFSLFEGEWPDDWFHTDGRTETYECSVYRLQCPVNLLPVLRQKIESLNVPKVWSKPRVYSEVDQMISWPYPPISTARVEVHWMNTAPLRPRFLTSRVIDVVTALHTLSLPRYEMMEILLFVPCIRLLSRRYLDYLVESLYKSIHKVTMFKTGPCRSTRRQLSIKR